MTGVRRSGVTVEADALLKRMKEAMLLKVREAMSSQKITQEVVAKALQLTDEAKSLLKNCANWSFNIF